MMTGIRVLIAVCALFFAGSPVFAQPSQVYGGWQVDMSTPGYVSVHTNNATGPLFGIICPNKGVCQYFISGMETCEASQKYPVYINAPGGATEADTTCQWAGNLQYLSFNESAVPSLNGVIRSNGDIGFAVPLIGGDFNVVKFQTYGAQTSLLAAGIVFPGDPPRQ